jgi:hypothetical protein
VGDPTGELTDRLHLLGLAEGLLITEPISDVADRRYERGGLIALDSGRRHFGRELGSVTLSPDDGDRRLVEGPGHVARAPLGVTDRWTQDCLKIPAEELVSLPAEKLLGRPIHVDDPLAFVGHDDRVTCRVENGA